MKIGVRCSPLHLKSDFPALVQWLAENGYEAVDLMGPDAEAKEIVEQAGLAIGSFDAPSVGKLINEDEAQRNAAAESLKAEITQAAGIGLKTLFVCFVPTNHALPRAKGFEIWKEVFPGVVAHAEAAGVNIAMEPWPGPGPHYPTLGCTPEMWRAMFAAVPSPNLGLCYDPSHLVRLGIDYIRVLDEFGERVHHVHAKDTELLPEEQYLHGRISQTFGRPRFICSEGWWRYCIPGDGEVNWRAVVVRLHSFGYTGALSVELEDGVYMSDGEANKAGLIAAKNHLRSVIR